MKKNVKLTIPHHPTIEGLTYSFITWYKDHSMTTSLRKALLANRWMEQMIQDFKSEYIRKYKISQSYAVRYPDEKLSNEDELEGDGLANLVGPLKKMSLKDPEKETEGPTPKRTTKKEKARKTTLQGPSGGGEKKAVKHQKGQGNEPEPMTSEPPPQKKRKGEGKKKKKRQVKADTAESIPRKKEAKGTPSATLRRSPDAKPPLALGVLVRAAPTSIGQKTSLDEQLEAHLLGTEPPAAVVLQSQTPTSLMAPQGPDMGGFLARLRKSIPWAGTQQTVVTTPIPRWSKQTWILVPVAEAQMTRPLTVKELLAKQAVKEIPEGLMLETPPPTTLRSPMAREVSTMETEGQEPITMDKEAQKEPTVPSSRVAANEPVIPANLECQVGTTGMTVVPETDAPMT